MAFAGAAYKHQRARSKKKSRLKQVRRKLILLLALSSVCIVLYFPVSRKADQFLHPPDVGSVQVDRYRDLNALHLKHARSGGIPAFKTDAEYREKAEALIKENQLVEITNSQYYVVEKLTHSHACLTPGAAALLQEIGERFHQKLKEQDLGKYHFKISSLLRTTESQKRLSRSNGNASPNSSHLYGTTFDIAYGSLVTRPLPWIERSVVHGPAIKVLSEVIGELRKEGKCVVVTERNERCFHITAVQQEVSSL